MASDKKVIKNTAGEEWQVEVGPAGVGVGSGKHPPRANKQRIVFTDRNGNRLWNNIIFGTLSAKSDYDLLQLLKRARSCK